LFPAHIKMKRSTVFDNNFSNRFNRTSPFPLSLYADFVFSLLMQETTFISVNEFSILVSFGSSIDKLTHELVLRAKRLIEQDPFIGLIETVPAYTSLAVYYNPEMVTKTGDTIAASVIHQLKTILQQRPVNTPDVQLQSVISIPVCYDESFGIDLAELSVQLSIPIEEIIRLHTSKTYQVFMIGFTPGFPYMGTIDKRLHTTRKSQPRLRVQPGAVAIAGEQTGIYPFATSGGWNIIGRTALSLFDRQKDNPFVLKAGDEVKFIPVTKEQFEMQLTGNNE
jgi:inhibitor of KinA